MTVHVDLDRPPTVVRAEDGRGPAISLDWDRAIDDEHHLRHCPVCGCPDLYVARAVPTMAGFAAVVLAGVVALVLLGSGLAAVGLIVFGVVLAVDLAVQLFTSRRLVCYRCRSEFRGLPIRRDQRAWDSVVAERYSTDTPGVPSKPGEAKQHEATT